MIQSLRRGLEILDYMGANQGEASVSDVARFLHVDPSTSSRLMATLEDRGFVHQDEGTQRYRLGTKLLRLGNVVLESVGFGATGRDVVRGLARETGETSHLAVLVEADVVYLDRYSGRGPLTVNTVVGAREPSYCTATGKALLSGLSDEEIRRLLADRPFVRHTPRTLRSINELLDELPDIREQHRALDREEFHAGVRCVASPVVDHRGRVVCAIGVSAPAAKFTDLAEDELTAAVVAAARRLSLMIGSVAG